MPDPIRVDIVSDVVCPWCVIGYFQLARAAAATGIDIEVHWHPFELNPQMAEDGEDLSAHLAAKYGTGNRTETITQMLMRCFLFTMPDFSLHFQPDCLPRALTSTPLVRYTKCYSQWGQP